MKQNITILGAGSWGTTLAILLSKKSGPRLILWTPFKEQANQMNSTRQNKEFLPGKKIPREIILSSDLKQALESDIIITAIPVKYLRDVINKVRGLNTDFRYKVFLSLSKGIEVGSFERPSQIIQKNLKVSRVAVLSGPTIAKEVAEGIPTVATVASKNPGVLKELQLLFKNTNLRVYRSRDINGTELAGALKNVIAIACGISDGLGFGTNTKSALVTRGLVEMARFGKRLGAKDSTFWGISGLGDVATTCFSPYSRNRFVGEELGKGKKLAGIIKNMKMVAEGVTTVKSVYNLSKKKNIEMPITAQVYLVLYKNKNPLSAVKALMQRPLKAE